MHVTIRTTIQEVKAAGHQRLATLAALGYALAFLGGVVIVFRVGVLPPLEIAGLVVQTPTIVRINQVLIYLGFALIVIGAILAFMPIMLVLSGFDPRRAAINILKTFFDAIFKRD